MSTFLNKSIKPNNYICFGSLSTKKFSTKSTGALFKRISNFKDGDESAKVFLAEHDFRLHNCNYKDVLSHVSQTPSEQKQFLQEIAGVIVQKSKLEPEQVLKGVSSSVEGNQEAQDAVLSLSYKAIKAAERLPIKPGVEDGLKESLVNLSGSELARLNEQGLGFKDVSIVDLPSYKSLVVKFTSQLDLASGPNPVESIDILIELSNANELVTFLSANHVLVKGLGLPMFMVGYYSLGSENSFKIFLGEVRDLVEWKLTPIYRSVKVSFSFVYKHKFKIISATSLVGFISHYCFFNFKVPLIKPLAPAPKLELQLESKWAPSDPLTKDRFVAVRDLVGQTSYMISNTFSSFFIGARHGVIDAAVTPEMREQIEIGVNKVVPVIVDTIVDYGETIKKKKL